MLRWAPVRFIRDVFREFARDKCDALAGSMAFFMLFSLAPLLALVVDIASLLVDAEMVRAQLHIAVSFLSGAEVADQATAVLDASREARDDGLLSRTLGVALVLFSATVVVAQAQRALNTVWGVRSRRGFKGFLLKRGIALALLLGFVLVLLASIASGAILGALGDRLDGLLPLGWSSTALVWTTEGVGFVLLATVSTAMHRWLPEARVPLSNVLWGGLVTAVLLQGGQVVISQIVAATSPGSVYGTARSLALLLFWVFYASALFLWGAEFIKVLARWRGHDCTPVRGARAT